MKSTPFCILNLVIGGALLAGQLASGETGSTFTYQGRLTDGGVEAGGTYDLRFSLYDAASGGGQVGEAVTNAAVTISNGAFTAALDFGPEAFAGDPRWLEIAVRKGVAEFTVLSPRQPITPTPYAMTAANLSAPLPESQLPPGIARLSEHQSFTGSNTFIGVVTASNPANEFAGSFRGDGSGLTNLDTSAVAAATNDLNTALSAQILSATNASWIAGTNYVLTATNDLGAALSAQVVAATNALWIASANQVAAATNDLNTTLSAEILAATNDLDALLSAQIVVATNALWMASTAYVLNATNDLNTALTTKISASTNDLLAASNRYHGEFTGNGAWLTNLVTTKIVAGSGIGITTNNEGQLTESITLTYTGTGGVATNAVSSIWTNGEPFAPLATNLNLIAGANVTLEASNWNNYGQVDITIHSNPQTNDLNTALVATITAATNDLNASLSAQIVAATNAPWIASTNLLAAATNDLNTALSAKIVAATNASWIASTNWVAGATNNLNTGLSARIVSATNDLNTALSAKIVAATNDLNTALWGQIVAATNASWIASTNWVAAQGYQTTNGITRKPISSATPSNGTNYVVDFANEAVQIAATNHITLVQSTNQPGVGWYGECVWYIQGGITNWTLCVNTNWIGVGTLAASGPYVVASNKLVIVAISARGSSETNVTYAISRQE